LYQNDIAGRGRETAAQSRAFTPINRMIDDPLNNPRKRSPSAQFASRLCEQSSTTMISLLSSGALQTASTIFSIVSFSL
jgi:hypothetical protein